MKPETSNFAPTTPRVRFSLGVTGHREDNWALGSNRARIEIVLNEIFDLVAAGVAAEATAGAAPAAPIRLHTMLSDGTDQIAAEYALARGWELIAPLPFGLNLNVAINAMPSLVEDARAMLVGAEPASVNVRKRAADIHRIAAKARLFELADQDAALSKLLLTGLQYPDDPRNAATFAAESSLRVALAAQVMIEQSDILIGIWDGVTRAFVGGTGHTIQVALETGAPVVWIDANAPDRWRILYGPEALASVHVPGEVAASRGTELQALVRNALHPAASRKALAHVDHGLHGHQEALDREVWNGRSNPLWHGYRRIEALFGADTLAGRFKSLRQTYETPEGIASGSSAPLLALARTLPGQDEAFVSSIDTTVLHRFAWSDGVSSRLSDTYRGGMIANFLLAPLAIVGGIAYLPFATPHEKWMFAGFELALLVAILTITVIGQQRRWHGRWFRDAPGR